MELFGKYKKYILILVTIIISCYKIHLGMHSDEVYLISLGDMIARENNMFYDCWSSLQTTAVFTAPFIRLFVILFHTTDGILLFFRGLSLIVKLGIALFFYFSFRKRYNENYVIIAVVIYYLYSADFQSFTYKQELIDLTMLSIIFTHCYFETLKKRYLVLIAVMISGSVLAYPTSLIAFPVFSAIIGAYVVIFLNKNRVQEALKALFIITATCVVCGTIFVLCVISKIGLQTFLKSLPYSLGDKNLNLRFFQKIVRPLVKIFAMGIMTVSPIFVLGRMNYRIKKLILPYVIPAIIVGAYLGQTYIERNSVTWHPLTYAYTVSMFLIPLFCFMKKNNKEFLRIFLLWDIPAIMVAICMMLASNQGNITVLYGMIFSAIGLIFICERSEKQENTPLIGLISKKTVWILLLVSIMSYGLVYEQETVDPEQTETTTIFSDRIYVKEGPAKGIFLAEDSYKRYSDIIKVVKRYVSKNDQLFIIDNIFTAPYGYLAGIGDYATYSPQGSIDSKRAAEFFELNEKKTPSIIIMNKKYSEKYGESTEIGRYISEKYTLYGEDNNYSIFRICN